MNEIANFLTNEKFFTYTTAIIALINKNKIIEFLTYKKKIKIKNLEDALECNFLSEPSKTHLKEEIANEYFYNATGIRVEKEFRDALILEHQKTNGALKFIHFKRALPHLVHKDSKLSVKLSKLEILEHHFNRIFGLFCLFFSILTLLPLLTSVFDVKAATDFSFLKPGIATFLLGLFMVTQTRSVFSAKYIKEQMDGEPHQCLFCNLYSGAYIKTFIKFFSSKCRKIFKRKKEPAVATG